MMRAGGRPPARECTKRPTTTSQPTAAPKRRRPAPTSDAAAPAEPQPPRAAAPAAAAEPTEVDWRAIRNAAPRTLGTWQEYVNEPEFWATYLNHQTDNKTNELVGVYEAAFRAKHSNAGSGKCVLDDAVEFGKAAWLSRVAEEDPLWEDVDAAELYDLSRDLTRGFKEPSDSGLNRRFRPGARLRVGRGGAISTETSVTVAGVRTFTWIAIDDGKLDALGAELGPESRTFRCVEAFAFDMRTLNDAKQRELLLDRARNDRNISEVDCLLRGDAKQRKLQEGFKEKYRGLERDVGLTPQLLSDLGVESLMDLDDEPLECLLGDKRCLWHKRVMDKFFTSGRRNPTRGVGICVRFSP